jgi:hypothetical protein
MDPSELIWVKNNNTFMHQYENDSVWKTSEPPLSGSHDYWHGGHLYHNDYWHVKQHPFFAYEREPWGYIKNHLAVNTSIKDSREVDEAIDRMRIWRHCDDDEDQLKIPDDPYDEGFVTEDSNVRVDNDPSLKKDDPRITLSDHDSVYVEGETPMVGGEPVKWDTRGPKTEEQVLSKTYEDLPDEDQKPKFDKVESSEPAEEVTKEEIEDDTMNKPKETQNVRDEPADGENPNPDSVIVA